jgi:ATP phosphoribosyltransferase regulatory subunit
VQAGVESIGRTDTAICDAEVFALALDCARRHGLARPRIRIGDTGLFRAVLDALGLPAAWRRKLARDFGRIDLVAADIASLEAVRGSPASSYAGILAALGGADRKAARALVEDLLAIGGHTTVGGRTVGEIADRFLEQADLKDGARVPAERLQVLQAFLALLTDAAAAPAALSDLLKALGTPVEAALALFAARTTALAAAGVDLASATFDPAFGRRLDYYSGFVFEMHDADRPDQLQVVGGGRYDGMLQFLGAPAPVPAVGFSVWVERLPGAAP